MLAVLAWIVVVPLTLALVAFILGDMFSLIDLDRIFPSRIALVLTLAPLMLLEFVVLEYLFGWDV